MAMPASGCIALRDCVTGIACSSISCAVTGTVGPVEGSSLSAMSVCAGKTAPHGMTEFYSYAPTPTALYFVGQTSCGSTTVSYCSACLCGVSAAGNCACVCACYYVNATSGGKTAGIACVLCNTTPIMACSVGAGVSATASFSFTIDNNDSVIFCVRGSTTTPVTDTGEGYLYICTITGIVGNYCVCTTSRSIYASAGLA